MEGREDAECDCQVAFAEAQRWVEAVTGKSFGTKDFRAALENGVLLCDLINKIKPGIIKKINRLSTPIAGLDNINVFLKACENIGLKEAQLFHPGDLQDLSNRVTVKVNKGEVKFLLYGMNVSNVRDLLSQRNKRWEKTPPAPPKENATGELFSRLKKLENQAQDLQP
ncbi:LIM domain only protein 7-like protein [Pitangus sulphuratus]|nr:LIM domain only protein 7-like protein [Pitangus sulphuratus]